VCGWMTYGTSSRGQGSERWSLGKLRKMPDGLDLVHLIFYTILSIVPGYLIDLRGYGEAALVQALHCVVDEQRYSVSMISGYQSPPA